LSLLLPDGTHETHRYDVATQEWQVQRIEGLPPAKVNPPPGARARIKKEQSQIRAARNRDSDLDGFLESFVWPAQGKISGVFGSQRILNGEPRIRTTASTSRCQSVRKSSRRRTAWSAWRARISISPAAR